jgi:hypothetical protein
MMKWTCGGPWRQAVAMTSRSGRPGAESLVVCKSRSPRADPPSFGAPETVVRTVSADGSSARPAASRLSSWCSWVKQDGVDWTDVVGGDRRPGEFA